jgi:uncharacterized protein YbjT (DUF2867 family)
MADRGVFLVTGATGLVGRSVLMQLAGRGVRARAMSRRIAGNGLPAGVEVVAADLDDPAGWADALRGDVEAVFLYPRGRSAEFLAAAARAGVARVVTLSSATISVRDRFPSPVAEHHAAVEAAADASGLGSAHLRPSSFAANTLSWASAVRGGGELRLAYPEARYASVHEADIAAVAVADLLDPPASGTVRDVTGPGHVSRAEQAETIARATGRALRITEIGHDRALRELVDGGLDEAVAATVMAVMARAVDEPEPLGDAVATATGRPARGYGDWVRDNLRAFR